MRFTAFGELYMNQTMASGVIPQITCSIRNLWRRYGSFVPQSLTSHSWRRKKQNLFVNSPNALDGNYGCRSVILHLPSSRLRRLEW